MLFLFLADQVLHHIGVYAHKTLAAIFLLQLVHHRRGQDVIQHQHVIPLCAGRLHKGVLLLGMVRIQIDQVLVLVGLLLFNQLFILLRSEIFPFSVLEEEEGFCPLEKFLIGQHPILDKNLQVIPFLFELLTLILVNLLQTVSDLFGDVRADLFHIGIALQVRAGDIQRNVGRVEHPMQ